MYLEKMEIFSLLKKGLKPGSIPTRDTHSSPLTSRKRRRVSELHMMHVHIYICIFSFFFHPAERQDTFQASSVSVNSRGNGRRSRQAMGAQDSQGETQHDLSAQSDSVSANIKYRCIDVEY